jgi:hypothetical protein
MDKSRVDIFVDKLPEGFLLDCREGVNRAQGNWLVFIQFDSEVVRPVKCECICLCVIEDLGVLVVFRRHEGEIRRWRFYVSGSRMQTETHLDRAREFADADVRGCSYEGDREYASCWRFGGFGVDVFGDVSRGGELEFEGSSEFWNVIRPVLQSTNEL